MIVEAMAQSGVEPTYCMGDDIPLPVLSDKPHMLYNYFKQRFAQVGGARRGCRGWGAEAAQAASRRCRAAPGSAPVVQAVACLFYGLAVS